MRAALQNLTAGEQVSGASTICQQLVRIRLFDADLMADPDRLYERKIKEWILALRVGERYAGDEGKKRILEMYMNQVYYGNQAYGIKAAAQAYFGKDITSDDPDDQLTIGEAAMLVGLVRAPSALDPTKEAVERRTIAAGASWWWPRRAGAERVQGFVLENMVESEDYITQAQADEAAAGGDRAGPAARQPVPRPALRLRRSARGGQAARRREPARPRRPAHRHHPAIQPLPALRREVGAGRLRPRSAQR